ncbi:MAG: prepilin-type N-terminal cleavage/methylation domain-containing protein [Sedimentisphaerales bacterium]|nr:prepilin-type N-terminal cleavage/methylation domain-containing protein [Sedimentisphaerales bacterium]
MQNVVANNINSRRGFTLMEVMIGMLLLTLVVGAVGVAMVHFSQRTGEARLTVTELQQQQHLVQIITDDLSRLNDITTFTDTQFTFTSGADNITYTWDGQPSGTFCRQVNAASPIILADDVNIFALQYQTINKDGKIGEDGDVLFALRLYLRQGADEVNTLVRTIELTNPLAYAELPQQPEIEQKELLGGQEEEVTKVNKSGGIIAKIKELFSR